MGTQLDDLIARGDFGSPGPSPRRQQVLKPVTLWTIGHSTRPWPKFLALLKAHAIGALADVRRFPGSRRHPQFGQENLDRSLRDSGMVYRHFPELGGRRQPRPDSANTVWETPPSGDTLTTWTRASSKRASNICW